MFEVAPAEDEDPVEAVSADGAHPGSAKALAFALGPGGDHFDAFAAEDLVEGVAELGVAIVDEEPKRLLFAELHDEVARVLGRPAPVRVRAAGDVLDPPGRERDEKQHVDPLEEHRPDGEEGASEHARCLRSQERTPRGRRTLRRRPQPCFKQHLPHRGGGDGYSDSLQLASDALVSPVWVLASKAEDRRAQRRLSGGLPGFLWR